MSAAARVGAEAIRCGTFLHRGRNRRKGIPKTIGFWRRFCSLLPPWAKGCRAGARNIPLAKEQEAGRRGRRPLRDTKTWAWRTNRGRGRTPPLCGCPEFYSFRGPTGRTYTCRHWRQVRDLIIAQTGGRPLLSACHVSGSEGRRRGDSLRNLFAPWPQSEKRNSKNHWFLAAFLQPFAAVGKRLSRRSAKYPFGERTRSGPSGTPAPTSARRGVQRKKRGRGRGTFPGGGKYTGGGKKIVRSGKKMLIFPVLSCKI